MTRDSYFMILVEVFKNHILAKSTIFHELDWMNRTQDYGIKVGKQVPNYSTLR